MTVKNCIAGRTDLGHVAVTSHTFEIIRASNYRDLAAAGGDEAPKLNSSTHGPIVVGQAVHLHAAGRGNVAGLNYVATDESHLRGLAVRTLRGVKGEELCGSEVDGDAGMDIREEAPDVEVADVSMDVIFKCDIKLPAGRVPIWVKASKRRRKGSEEEKQGGEEGKAKGLRGGYCSRDHGREARKEEQTAKKDLLRDGETG